MNHRPSRALRPVLLAAALAALAGCNPDTPATTQPTFYQRLDEGASLDQATALSMINAHRARTGLAPLTLDAGLSQEARRRAASVAETDTSTWGETPVVAASASAGSAQRLERVSAGYRTFAEAFSGWRDSPQHNKVMLSPSGRRLGIAAVDRPGTKYRVYWGLIVEGP